MTDTTAGDPDLRIIADTMVEIQRQIEKLTGARHSMYDGAVGIAKYRAAQPSAGAQVVGWIKRTSERHPIGLTQPSDWRFSPHKPALGEGSKAEWFDVHPVCIATPAQPDTGDVAALREALEPFVKAAGRLDGLWDDDDWRWNNASIDAVTVKDLRRLAALSKPNAQGATEDGGA